MTNRVNLRLPFALSAAALVAFAGGCGDRESAADKAITTQAREMHALSGDSPSPSFQDVEAKQLGTLNSQLAAHASGGNAGEKAAASMMIAQSNLTLAEHAMGETGLLVSAMGNAISEVDGHLGAWRKHQAIKEAAASYDPAPQLAEIAKSKAEKDTAIAAEKQRQAELQSKLDALQAKVKQMMDSVAGRETQYAQLIEQASKLSATEGVPLVTQANGVKREADSLRMAGTKLQAQADVLIPQVRESQAIVNQLENQKKDSEATEVALAKHLADSREAAAKAGAEAEKAGAQVTEALARVTKAHEDAQAGFAKAQGFYTKAVQAAREASKDAGGKAVLGDAQLATAYMHWKNSHSQRVYAALLSSLANVQPPLRESASLAAKATEAQAAAKAAAESAAESLEQAKSSFEGTRVQGAAKERIEALVKVLESAISVSKDQGTNVSPELAALAGMNVPPGTMSETSSTSAAASPPAGGDAKATAVAFFTAAKNEDQATLFTLMDLPDDVKSTLAPMAIASKRLDDAFKAKFGKTFTEAAAEQPGVGAMMGNMSMGGGFNAFKDVDTANLTVETVGDTATATAGAMSLTLRNVAGKWLVSIPEMNAMGGQLGAMAPMLKTLAGAMDSLATEVESGKYADANAAFAAFMTKVQSAMGGMMPPGGG
jgi:hypothetical protein